MLPKRGIRFAFKCICIRCAALVLLAAGCVRCECTKDSPTNEMCPFISDREVERTFFELRNVTEEREELDRMLIEQGMTIDPTAKVSDISLLRRHWKGPLIHMYEQNQLPFHAVSTALIKKYNLTSLQIQEMLPLIPMVGPYGSQAKLDCSKAFPIPICDPNSKYRTLNGTCNNLDHPLWGSANSCARRLLPAHYTGDSGFRESILGGPLPTPRNLSINIHSDLNSPSTNVTQMFVFFGQLLTHDVTQTPISVTAINRTINCCLIKDNVHPQCATIPVKPDDYFYSEYGVQCINFVRSAICPTCSLGERNQINEITAFVDASILYGNHADESEYLRTNDGTGRLRAKPTPHGDLLPASAHPENDQCSFLNTSFLCFESGDARSNQHNTLTSLHILLLREHNRLADALGRLNPQWDDDRIFQEARRIVGAEMQTIAYKEWLPIALGPERMSHFSLSVKESGYTDYDPSVDPSTYTEFSSAALRFGHSLVNSVVGDFRTPSGGNETRLLRNDFFKPFELQSGIVGPHFKAKKPCQWFGRNLVPDVNNFLYRRFHGQAGLDLAAINIQRGRDHGLPPYIEVVEFCSNNNSVIHDFDDLVQADLIPPENVRLLQQNYRHVDDIDLWTGVLSENAIQNSFIGPTGACILGLQFHNLKFGDRFFFEHRNQSGSFNYNQLQELRKTTLTKLICENTNVQEMPRNALLFESDINPLVPCRDIEEINISFWKE